MKTTMRPGVPFAWFLGLLLVAATAGAQDAEPASGRLTVTTSAEEGGISGRFSSKDGTVDYASRISFDGQAVASVSGADGNVLAEAVVSPEQATIIIAGVQITSETELTEDEASAVEAFSETRDAAVIRALVTALADEIPPRERGKISGLIAIAMMLGEGKGARTILGDCFGCCGPGCWGCWLAGNCYTTACAVHDGCVERYGHKDKRCLALLAVAIASYVSQCL